MAALVLKYPEVINLFGVHAMKQRSESRQFLAWFLENYYRLDPTEVADSICDGNYDKGIDGIYVNSQLGQIDVFQATLARGAKALGDTALKEFAGTLTQLKDRPSVDNLTAKSQNPALVSLLKSLDIPTKVEEGFNVQGVFITNSNRDDNAIAYLSHTPSITLFDHDTLQSSYTPLNKTEPIQAAVSFNVADIPHMEYNLSPKVKMVISSLPAIDLVKMTGIANGELFAWNVRQWLGRKTKVNKDIETSIKNASDHQLFPAFHNGLTVLCKTLKVKNDKITIAGYAVVNGCQSLTSLYENRKNLTSDLRIITKFINVPPDGELAAKITDHTNNQNGTTFRDMQSNNPIQVRLQSEIHKQYDDALFYRIKRGERPEWPPDGVIENELVARVLLAFDLKEPSSCHQTYKLFDELHSRIFGRPAVNADRIILAFDIYQIVFSLLSAMKNELFGKYNLTRYLIIYLIREALETDSAGIRLCENPSPFLKGAGARDRLANAIKKSVAKSIVTLLDTEATRRTNKDEFFDYKSDLKSPKKVQDIRASIIGQYQIIADSKYAPTFSEAWEGGAKKAKVSRTKKKAARLPKR